MKHLTQCVVLGLLASVINCDDLFVVNSPEGGIAFSDTVKEVKSSELENILDTVSGVTSPKGSWAGARVLSPFRYPQLVSLVTVAVSDPEPLPGSDQWKHFKLDGPSPDADTAFHKLHVRLAGQPNTLPTIKLEAEQDEDFTAEAPQSAGSLNASKPAARLLLRELSLLDGAGAQLTEQPGRRAVLLSLHALPGAAAEGAGAAAARQLTEAVERYAAAASQATDGRALTLLLTQPVVSRRARSLMADPTVEPDTVDLNLAGVYSDDYPVIFNILLITSLILVYILVAFSIMTAYMDPGKDSIIYRMTNPNMKKNN
ncbi:ATPase H(+)-transporting accessory protein 2-like [Amphibalanus amphitrite]|uniref:ATPase H(+)-transporting accessory protein 2-like n=1 Tax=Amphibalanus amphitrite TaxID=1232801 RepID=UPI001C90A375|nr:ATPase H(+)-transporting accessory protein 2-like [Amphibalanus amphitrite]XP_043190138.1 ATPase H(+)-transporting accessory protein 2-like [Amphibalanus amphitrite]XP_043190139.1 ATPase H(+)-transporting accessory protein 2-like [Amphibalanus amphitrite]XP_043190140.1 ATPase H(+)-transporting accessory protein 2-like [Amphibalanus amphitrite]XP_043190141.1 ATPase H(+)-transporting accessory protein 2-like [Amphibalanus amphitrite]